MKFTIDRPTWDRGKGTSRLINLSTGCRCCIGHFLKACGVRDDAMSGLGNPSSIAHSLPSEAEFLVSRYSVTEAMNSDAAHELIVVNDDADDRPDREERIVATFAAAGHEAVFIN